MGKIRTRTKGQGKRWPKGQSCVSNPEISRHRDQAKSRFFQDTYTLGGKKPTTSSALTCDAVQKHDILNISEQPIRDGEMAVDGDAQSESGDTIKTFASDWTNCTNKSFSRLLTGFQASNAQHKEMLAVLAAVTEVIKSRGGLESDLQDKLDNQYFLALMTALGVSETEINTTAVVTLLGMVIKRVAPSILQSKFEEISQALLTVLVKYSSEDNTAVLRGLLGCLTEVLCSQNLHTWKNNTLSSNVLTSLLTFITHSKPKVRKCAQHAVGKVLINRMTVDLPLHPLAAAVGDYCISVLEGSAGNCSTTTVLHTLGFLKGTMACFPSQQLKACCESVLKVMTLGDPRVTMCGLQALNSMMTMRPKPSFLPPALNARLINALYDYQPAATDTEPILVWFSVMQEAYSNLALHDRSLCLVNVPRFATCVSDLLLSEKLEVLSGSALALKVVVLECLGEPIEDAVLPVLGRTVSQLLTCLQACLKFQYHVAWKYVIHVLAALYQVAGGRFPELLTPSLKLLASLREGKQFSLAADVDKAIGMAVQSMGPGAVLAVVPLQITGQEKNYEFPRSWMLPVLKENIRSAELAYFTKHIYPLASACKVRSEELAQQKEGIGSHSYELLYAQLWALLPSFCNAPSDLQTSFKGLAKLLGVVLKDRRELRLDVMAGLRRLVTSSLGEEGPRAEMTRFAKNYLPILLNIYTSVAEDTGEMEEEGQRLAALETIKVYLQVASPELCHDLFDRAYNKMTSIPQDEGKKAKKEDGKDALLQLLAVLLPYQDGPRVTQLYQLCSNTLLASQDHKEQKRGYRVIEELCRSEGEECKQFVKSNLAGILATFIANLENTKPPSRAPRLRCLLLLLGHMEVQHQASLQSILPEAVLCCRDINAKCRGTAYTLLLQIGQTLQRWTSKPAEDVVRDYLALVLPGLQGSVNLVSATILALASLMNEYGDLMPDDVIGLLVHNMTTLLTTSTREVAGPCLSFFKAFLSVYDTKTCGPHMATLVQSLVEMSPDCKMHFRVKCRELLVRLVRRYGVEVVSAIVPDEDTVMMKRLKNIRKELGRKARVKDGKDGQHESDDENMELDFEVKPKTKSIQEILAESDDDDSNYDDLEEERPSKKTKQVKKKSKAWIHENADSLMDFTDPTASRKITATNPRLQATAGPVAAKDKNRGFAMAPDGRLIITEESDSEGEGGKRRGKRKGKPIAVDSDEDPGSDNEEEEGETSRAGQFVLAPGSKRRRALSLTSVDALSEPAMKYQAGGSGIHRPTDRQRAGKSSAPSSSHSGTEYQAKKAKGDVKKKGKFEPYAYTPLNSKLLNRRKRAKHVGQMKQLEVSAQKGAQRGSKARAKVLGRRRK